MKSATLPSWGTFFGVGVGPGDPELMTLKAQRILKAAPVICVPKSREDAGSYVQGIVAHLVDPARQEVMELVFPMTKDRARLEAHWAAATERVAAKLGAGQDVAFVTEGDPFIYSTFMHLYSQLRKRYPDVPVEVVPGVSSINCAAAVAGVPLVDGAERLAILPATYEGEQLAQVLKDFDTVVLLKVNRVFDHVLDTLESLGLDEKAVFVSRCGSEEQQVVRNIGSLRGQELEYLSLVIVKK